MCCCRGEAKWKREVINDHKFDFVDVDEFYEDRFFTKFKYCFIFLFTIKSILIYVLDIYTAVMLIFFNSWTSDINKDLEKLAYIRWIFVGSIIASYILLFLELKKARAVILSSDISFTFTSIIANRYYTLRSYAHYCFFNQIHNQKRFKDDLAFFVFFALKGWKRMFFAEAARRFVNGYTLFFSIKGNASHLNTWYLGLPIDKKISIVTMGIPCLLFIVSAITTMFAAVLYIPLVCEIRGNLKEYCCHKIDKRISELLRTRNRKRIIREQLLNGTVQPTKPNIDAFKEEFCIQSSLAQFIDTEEKKYALEYRIDAPSTNFLGPRGEECVGRKMSLASLTSESSTTSGATDRRAQAIAANREYRTKQQRQCKAQQNPTLPYIDKLHKAELVEKHDSKETSNDLSHLGLHPNSDRYISTGNGLTLDNVNPPEYSNGVVIQHTHTPAIPYLPPNPYQQYETAPKYSLPPSPSIQISYQDRNTGDLDFRANSPTRSEVSGRSGNSYPFISYQPNMPIVQEELPNRYQNHHPMVNRDTPPKGQRAKPPITKNTSCKNAINF